VIYLITKFESMAFMVGVLAISGALVSVAFVLTFNHTWDESIPNRQTVDVVFKYERGGEKNPKYYVEVEGFPQKQIEVEQNLYNRIENQGTIDILTREGFFGFTYVISFREYEPFARDYKIMEMDFFHIPIIDFDVPEPEDIDRFINLMEKNRDRKILIHCLAGLGRTGTMVALYLKYRGMSGPIAVHHVRRLRPGAIQTLEQVELVLDYEFQRKHRE